MAFSPDDKLLASASEDKTVKLWEIGLSVVLQPLEGHTDFVNAVAFSTYGKTLMSGSSDKTVKLWDVESGTVLRTIRDILRGPRSGSSLLTGRQDVGVGDTRLQPDTLVRDRLGQGVTVFCGSSGRRYCNCLFTG